MVVGAGVLICDQKECWGRKSASLCHITRTVCKSKCISLVIWPIQL